MAGSIFLDRYQGESLDALLALETTHRVDSLVGAMESALTAKAKRLGTARLSDEERLILETEQRPGSFAAATKAVLGVKVERLGTALLSDEERVILAVEALEREVNNGGYHQFFTNSSGAHAGEIESALRAIGCPQQAEIARRAIETLRIDGPITADSVEEAASDCSDEVADALGSLSREYYACDEPIAERLFDFVKANRSHIRLP